MTRQGYSDTKHEVRDLQHRTESIPGAVGKHPVFHRFESEHPWLKSLGNKGSLQKRS